jgi:alpha-L-fucosidase 2
MFHLAEFASIAIAFAAVLPPTGSAAESVGADPCVLWYDKPAVKWEEALPVGNGRLGAMVFGQPAKERLQLNENTLWAGGPYDPVNPEAREALPEIRQLIDAAKYREAAKLIGAKFMAKPLGQMPYQTVGDLLLTFPDATIESYRRDLDLDTATATVSYTSAGVRHTREVFASAPDNVIAVRLAADRPGAISFAAGMKTPMAASVETEGGETLILRGVGGDAGGLKGRIKYQARVKVIARGGKVTAESARIAVTDADEVTLLITAATSYVKFDDVTGNPDSVVKDQLAAAAGKSFADLRAAHLADFRALFRHVTIDLGRTEAMKMPTDVRIQRFAKGEDPQLAALYYQFGRYLLICSSRPDGQPAGLQGLWNESQSPPWGGKYTININTEMNYWPAESGNLAECVEPLMAMVSLRFFDRRFLLFLGKLKIPGRLVQGKG